MWQKLLLSGISPQTDRASEQIESMWSLEAVIFENFDTH